MALRAKVVYSMQSRLQGHKPYNLCALRSKVVCCMHKSLRAHTLLTGKSRTMCTQLVALRAQDVHRTHKSPRAHKFFVRNKSLTHKSHTIRTQKWLYAQKLYILCKVAYRGTSHTIYVLYAQKWYVVCTSRFERIRCLREKAVLCVRN